MPRQGTTAVHHNMTSAAAKDTGSPGGEQAQSNTARLQEAFPDSPMLGDNPTYDPDAVSLLRYKLVTNQIGDDPATPDEVEPRAEAQTYWGFEDPKWTALDYAPTESDPDLAPDLDGQPANAIDIAGNIVASYLGPNLRPPPINNPTAPVIDDDNPAVLPDLLSTPPFIGNGKANPRKSSLVNKEKLVESQAEGNTPLVKGGNPSSDYAGDIGADAGTP